MDAHPRHRQPHDASIAPSITDNGGCFELLGFDVMIDEQSKPWLLEVHCPDGL